MFDLSGLANNISSQVIILLVILGLVSLVVAVLQHKGPHEELRQSA